MTLFDNIIFMVLFLINNLSKKLHNTTTSLNQYFSGRGSTVNMEKIKLIMNKYIRRYNSVSNFLFVFIFQVNIE